MTVAAIPNFGKQFWMAPAGQALVQVAELISLKNPNPTHGIVDVTTHDSATDPDGGVPMEKIKEPVYDPGQVTGSHHYIAGSTMDEMMIAARNSPEVYDFKIVVPTTDGAKEELTFSGFVTSYEPQDAPVRGVQVANFTVEVTGVIDQKAA